VRCFVALWPDRAVRARLAQLAAGQQARFASARAMRAENLHLTLAFIGAVDEATATAVATALRGIEVTPFDWRLDAIGAFEHARVLWAGGPRDCRLDGLAAAVRARLDALGVPYDRQPFTAHVTLLRDLPRAQAAAQRVELPSELPIQPPIIWPLARPLLLQSTTEQGRLRYRPLNA
jgi:2'-5' RNA ligase